MACPLGTPGDSRVPAPAILLASVREGFLTETAKIACFLRGKGKCSFPMPPFVKEENRPKRKNRPSRIENSMAGAENLESPNGHAYFALARERWRRNGALSRMGTRFGVIALLNYAHW